jgi:epsin
MDALKRAANLVRDKLTKSPLERDLTEAMNNENWGASNSLLHSIAERSFDTDDAAVIMKAVWESISASGREWRRLYKTLVLIDILLKHGSTRCVAEIRDETFKIRLL